MTTALLIILIMIMLMLGMIGLINPTLPGLPLLFGAAWLLAYLGDYRIIGTGTLTILGIITIAGMAMDFISGLLGAKAVGASKTALWGAFLGGVFGIFLLLPGMIFGPLIGAAFGEWIARRDLHQAGKVGIGTFIGFIVGMTAKIGCALSIVLTVFFLMAAHGIGMLFR